MLHKPCVNKILSTKMRGPRYRLSPNEVERLVKEERERLRKLRIVQVREQAKANAAIIRNQVQNEKERLLAEFTNEVKKDIEAEKAEKVRKLEQKYDSTLRSIGQGHTEVLLHGDGQNIAERVHKRLENEEKAMERFITAMDKHELEKTKKEWEEQRNIRNRAQALEVEKERSAVVAALPPPPSDGLSELEEKSKPKKAIPMTDMKSFAATHYHIPDYQVVKAGPDEQLYDAKADAEEQDLRLKQDLKEKKRSLHERVEKARIRGNEALQKEMLKHDLGDMLKDLSLLQRKDRKRRQAVLAEVPNQVFIPPDQCLQERAEQQQEMERQFEEIYTHKLQRPEQSTLQSWAEMPGESGDDTNIDSELSTLESVPLPPLDGMAFRRVPASSRQSDPDQKVQTSKQPDTVLKQLLSKIKEQRQNVFSNQKQEPSIGLTNERARRQTEKVSMMSAKSHVSSNKSDEDNTAVYVESKELYADRDEIMSQDTDSSSGSRVLSHNNALIGELQQRIQKIEDQKLRLAEQLQSQTDFYQELHKQQQELQALKIPLPSSASVAQPPQQSSGSVICPQDGDSFDATLESMSLSGRVDSDHKLNAAHETKTAPPVGVRILPGDENNRGLVDLSTAASKLRPVAGIYQGVNSPQFQLLASNGFLPASDVHVEREGFDHGRDGGLLTASSGGQGNSLFFEKEAERRKNLLQLDSLSLAKEGGARRMIDFGGGAGRKRGHASVGDSSARSEASVKSFDLHLSQPTGESSSDFATMEGEEDPMRRKVRDYHARAQELQSSMDESTLTKVRDYQQHILQTHEDRKQLLDNIREDIEQRRQALYSSSKFAGSGGAFLMNLGTASIGGIRANAPPASMSSAASYPMLSSSIDSRQYLTGSQSEQILQEPIKPFISDSWLRRDVKTQSILKPSSQFESQWLRGEDISTSKHSSQPQANLPSSIEKIKKSLAFDDLDSNQASPTFYSKDESNVTSASRTSHPYTDDSKLTSSEEDRGSPILHGSRSEHWDTSDKSNNSITGSSSLNGSALVARAEERREGFERRQQELRNQLMDIQSQKEAILQRYYKGQQALYEQQKTLRQKLASGDQPNTSTLSSSADGDEVEYNSRNKAEPKRSLMGVQSQLEFKSTTRPEVKSVASLHSSGPAVDSYRPENWASKLSTSFQGGNGSDRIRGNGSDRFSGRSSGSSTGSHNLTGDAYLDEISYHKVEGSEAMGTALPHAAMTSWSALSQKRSAGVKDTEEMVLSYYQSPAEEDSSFTSGKDGIVGEKSSHGVAQGGFGTWASLLSSGKSSSKPTAGYPTMPSRSIHSLEEDSGNDFSGSYEDEPVIAGSTKSPEEFEGSGSDPASIGPYSQMSVSHHQPHELSTIIEVDTPTTTRSFGRSTTTRQGSTASQSLQSLVSLPSSGSLHSHPFQASLDTSEVQVDTFPDLPQVLPVTRHHGAPSSSSQVMVMDGQGQSSRSYALTTGGFVTGRSDARPDQRGEADGIALTEVSLGATSSYTLESEPADLGSGLESSGGFNLSP